MNKYLSFFIFIVLSLITIPSFAQIYDQPGNYGISWNRGAFKIALHLPASNGRPSNTLPTTYNKQGAIVVDTTNKKIYLYFSGAFQPYDSIILTPTVNISNIGGTASNKILVLKGAASQSGNLFEYQDVNGISGITMTPSLLNYGRTDSGINNAQIQINTRNGNALLSLTNRNGLTDITPGTLCGRVESYMRYQSGYQRFADIDFVGSGTDNSSHKVQGYIRFATGNGTSQSGGSGSWRLFIFQTSMRSTLPYVYSAYNSVAPLDNDSNYHCDLYIDNEQNSSKAGDTVANFIGDRGQTAPLTVWKTRNSANTGFSGKNAMVDKDAMMFAQAYYATADTFITSDITSFVKTTPHHVYCTTTSGNITITLDKSTMKTGEEITIKKITSDGNTVTVTPSSGNIDGVSSYVITSSNESITIRLASDGNFYNK